MATATIYADIDSHMDYENPDINSGTAVNLRIGTLYAGEVKTNAWRPILNFDVSALIGKTINTTKLTREIFAASPGGFSSYLSRCTRPSTWTEGGVTWNKYDGTNTWTAGGGDFDDTGPPAKIDYTEANSTGPHDIIGLKALVDDALDNRSGILSIILRPVVGDPEVSDAVTFRSREMPSPDEAMRPKLVIEYVDRRRVVPQVV